MRNSIKTRRKAKDGFTYGIIYFCAFFTVAALIAIVGYILINGWAASTGSSSPPFINPGWDRRASGP